MFLALSYGTAESQSTMAESDDWFGEESLKDALRATPQSSREQRADKVSLDEAQGAATQTPMPTPTEDTNRLNIQVYRCSFCKQLGHNRYVIPNCDREHEFAVLIHGFTSFSSLP